ncbi:hypothetical protein NEMBOFW57_006303 [Staphylotrichum longicolle]|uniref:Uncharacterized protein n=1 Tax=Staphylotrichum longicolle TaxID=669026 RepID=A0AAD4EYT0_9PEZI|nr:hypothetical protein NEMBOFW57_006303 [Staphylotrichum longicolle]
MKQGLTLLSALAWLQVASAGGCCRSNRCLKAIADPLVNGQADCSSLIETVTVTPEVTTVTETATEIPTEYATLVETDISTVTVTSTVSTETLLSTIDTTVATTVTQRSIVQVTRPYATVTVFVTSTSTVVPQNTVTVIPRRGVDTALAPPSMPSYASAACQSWDKYVSACRCVSVTQQTVTASASAATVTVTVTDSAASTISVPTTISTTTTIVESKTATETDVQINTALVTATVSTTVTGNVLVIGSTGTVTSTVIQTVAPPAESCRSDAGNFRAFAPSSAGGNLYMYAETSGSPGGVSGSAKWMAPPTSSTNAGDLYKYQWYVDESGLLAMTYASGTLKLAAWVSTTAAAPSVPLMVSSSVGSPSIYTRIPACVSSVTGALTLIAAGRTNILMCGQNLYLSSGTGSDTGLPCTRMYPKIASV